MRSRSALQLRAGGLYAPIFTSSAKPCRVRLAPGNFANLLADGKTAAADHAAGMPARGLPFAERGSPNGGNAQRLCAPQTRRDSRLAHHRQERGGAGDFAWARRGADRRPGNAAVRGSGICLYSACDPTQRPEFGKRAAGVCVCGCAREAGVISRFCDGRLVLRNRQKGGRL